MVSLRQLRNSAIGNIVARSFELILINRQFQTYGGRLRYGLIIHFGWTGATDKWASLEDVEADESSYI